jgi:hypothetical protein
MFKLKDFIIRWAIKQIVKDGQGTYAQMRYLEDVLENGWGEKMFVFSHRLVPINQARLDAANKAAAPGDALSDTNATPNDVDAAVMAPRKAQ